MAEKRKDLLEKLKAIEAKRAEFEAGTASPGSTIIEKVLGPCEIVIGGRPTLMFGSNNYLGLTFDPEVMAAAREAIVSYGTGTTGSRTANGTMSLHEQLERDLAEWFGKRHALIFSTGYQANLSVIGGLCGPDDVILIDADSHASIYDATRQTTSQVVAFRHNSPESLRKKLERLPKDQRNRLVVAEGLYSIRGDVAPLRDLVEVAREYGAYVMVDEAHSLGTFSKSLAGIGGVCVSDHRELRSLHFLARAYVFTASGSPAMVASVRAAVRVIREHPELREKLWSNIRQLRAGLTKMGYVIGSTESPIVPIFTGDELRTIALWQELLASGLYVNLIVPPGCSRDDCLLRASCSAAHTPQQIATALEIFERARVGVPA